MKIRRTFSALILGCLCCFFLLSGCSSQTPDADLKQAVTHVYETIIDPNGEGWLEEFDEEKGAEVLGIDSSTYTDFEIYASERSTRCTVFAGFHAAEEKSDALRDSLENAKSNAVAAFDGFLPDQHKIAKEAEVKQYGDYWFLIMTEENEAVVKELEHFFDGTTESSGSSAAE